MKRFTIFSLTCFLSMGSVFAQQGVTQCGVPTGQPKFPLQAYQELPDPAAPSDKEWAAVTTTQVSSGFEENHEHLSERLARRTCECSSGRVDRHGAEGLEFQLYRF